MTHAISITTIGRNNRFTMYCSCGERLLDENLADLTYLNDLAHEHIEAAEDCRVDLFTGRSPAS